MKSKILIFACLILFIISISSVSAMENSNQSLIIDDNGGLSSSDVIVSDADDNLMISNENEIISTDVKGSFSDLRNAVASSNQITLTGDVTCLSGDEDVYINSGRDVSINGNGHTINANNLRRAFVINPGGSLHLSNLKIINADSYKSTYTASGEGGAILNLGSLTVVDCIFENNYGRNGGAIGASMGASTVISGTNTFSNNKVTHDGGAISNNGGSTLTISGKNFFNCNFANDKGNEGKAGAILNSFSNAHTIIKGEAIFTNNQAALDGGAIFNHQAIFEIDGTTTFRNNKAIGSNRDPTGKGGAIANEDATFKLAGKSTFTSNSAGRGGAIDSSLGSQFTLSGDAEFKSNTASVSGGAIANERAKSFSSSANNNFDSNKAGSGGAFYSYLTPVSFSQSSVFYKNTATTSGGAMHLGDVKPVSFSGHLYFYDNGVTGNGGSGGAIFAAGCSNFDLKGHVFLRNYASHAGGAIFVNNNPISASYNIFIANDARTSGDDVEVFNSNVGSFDMNYWGIQSKPSQDKIHNYNIGNIRSWVILQSIIPDEIKQNQEVNLVRFVSNSNSNLGGEMGDFAISATPDFTSLNIHRNVGSSKYTGKTVGPMTVSLSGPDFNVNKRVNVVEDKSKTQLKGNNVVLKDPSQSANYQVTLTDVNGNVLSGKTVTITVDGKKYTKTTDAKGIASLTLSGLANGYHKVESSYAGEDKYYDSSTTNGIICAFNNESTTQLQTRDIEMYFKDGTRYGVKLMDSAGKALANKEIYILISGIIYTRTTNENGEASIAINLNSGTHDVMACFPGDASNEFAFVENTIIVKPTISGNDITKHYKNGTQYYAKFVGKDGKALTNTKIKYNINGVFYERTTDANGYAKMNINLIPGRYVITATNPVNGEMYSNIVTVLTIFEGKDVVKYYRNDTQYIVKILGDDGKPKSGVTVSFNINGVFYNRVTNESGYAKMNLNLIPGDYIITAEYNGLRYSNNIKILPVLSARDVTMSYRDGTKFEVKVLDGQGNAYPNQNITFNINGVFYQKVTDDDGYARLNINLMPGEYIITSEYGTARIANKINIR